MRPVPWQDADRSNRVGMNAQTITDIKPIVHENSLVRPIVSWRAKPPADRESWLLRVRPWGGHWSRSQWSDAPSHLPVTGATAFGRRSPLHQRGSWHTPRWGRGHSRARRRSMQATGTTSMVARRQPITASTDCADGPGTLWDAAQAQPSTTLPEPCPASEVHPADDAGGPTGALHSLVAPVLLVVAVWPGVCRLPPVGGVNDAAPPVRGHSVPPGLRSGVADGGPRLG